MASSLSKKTRLRGSFFCVDLLDRATIATIMQHPSSGRRRNPETVFEGSFGSYLSDDDARSAILEYRRDEGDDDTEISDREITDYQVMHSEDEYRDFSDSLSWFLQRAPTIIVGYVDRRTEEGVVVSVDTERDFVDNFLLSDRGRGPDQASVRIVASYPQEIDTRLQGMYGRDSVTATSQEAIDIILSAVDYELREFLGDYTQLVSTRDLLAMLDPSSDKPDDYEWLDYAYSTWWDQGIQQLHHSFERSIFYDADRDSLEEVLAYHRQGLPTEVALMALRLAAQGDTDNEDFELLLVPYNL